MLIYVNNLFSLPYVIKSTNINTVFPAILFHFKNKIEAFIYIVGIFSMESFINLPIPKVKTLKESDKLLDLMPKKIQTRPFKVRAYVAK